MVKDDDQYHITEGDVAGVIDYMKLNHNKQLTREQAVKLLQRIYTRQKVLEHFSPEAIEEELKDLEEY